MTAGVRFDVSTFKNTAYTNAAADALTFRDNEGAPIQFDTGSMPDTKILWSPRVGANWDVAGDQITQIRGGTGLFSGRPAYVWISNQIGNTGVLLGERIVLSPGNAFPFTTDPSRYYGVATGASASSYQLNVTDPDFQLPAGVAHERRARSEAAGRHCEHDRAHLHEGRERHLLLQRQPAGCPEHVRRRRQPAALDRSGVRGRRPGRPLHQPHQQRDRATR